MDKHIETLEELRSFHKDFAFANIEEASRIIPALDAAIALMRGQSGLSGVVRDAKFGLAMIEVDCSYFGPHMIGPRDSVRIFVEQKAPPPQDDAAQQENQK